MLDVKILGSYGSHGHKLEEETRAALDEHRVSYQLTVENNYEIIRSYYGIFTAPALVINGQIYCCGRIPKRSEIVFWATEKVAL